MLGHRAKDAPGTPIAQRDRQLNFQTRPDGLFLIPASAGAPARQLRCALGPAGVVAGEAKREGDGGTPAGRWPMLRLLYRPDRGPPPATGLAAIAIAPDDGWCDAPDDPAYNRPVRLPYPASAESMWREDGLYDLVVVLGFNDNPPVPGRGSAIFLHCARADYAPTQGCVALARDDLQAVLALAGPGSVLEVLAGPRNR
jgi:L,D-peptidoglycan transpeptidase YkuD (ErfK/YbiS/YcfS/YnhG family)